MTGKLCDQGLDTLERRFQALRDQIGALPEACRPELEGALQELSQAIAALRADREAGESPRPAPPGGREAQARQGGESHSPVDPAAYLGHCESMLHHVFNAIPDLLTVHDRDFNTIMSNWHGHESVPEAERQGQPKCYRVYHHRDRPCDDCHVLEVLATGQPVKVERVNLADGRIREVSSYPIRDESGRVVLVVEHVRDRTDRHLAEQALKESEGRFRTLIEDSPESLFLTDVRGTILAASRVAARRLGKNLEEIIGAALFDLFPPEVAARRRVMFEQAVATGRPLRLEDARGGVHFDVNINPILDADGKVSRLSILGIDITDRKNAEQALKESEERFRAIFETAQDSIFIKDRSFRYSQVNPAMERLFARPAAEIIGKTDAELFGEEAGARIREQDQPVLAGELVKEVHTVPVLGVPTTFHVIKMPLQDDRGKVIGLCGIARDITDLKQAEDALKESEERFRMLFEHAPDAYILADMQGEIIDCNQATEELAGYGREELIGNNFACLPWLDFRQQVRLADLLAQAARGEVLGPVDFTLTRKDGREVIAEGMSLPLYIQGQNLVLTIVRDITARKRAEEELCKNHLELQATAQRLEQSRNMLQLIIESIPVRVFWKDRDLRFLGCNTLFALDAGFNHPQQLLGKDDFAMGWREQAHLYRMDDRQVMESLRPKMNMVEPQTTPAGAKIWLKTSKVPLQMPNGEVFGVLGIYEDITTYKQAEEALRESEVRFRHISSTISDISYSCTAGPDGSYVIDWLAGAAERITGYSGEEIKAQRCWGFLVIEADQPRFEKHIIGLTAGSSGSCELRLRHKNGGIVWVASFAKIVQEPEQPELISLYGGLVDITERKRAEEALKQANEYLLLATTAGGVGIWNLDVVNNKLTWDDQMFRFYGRAPEKFGGAYETWKAGVHPEDIERVDAEVQMALRGEKDFDMEFRVVWPNGPIHHINARACVHRDAAGQPTEMIGTNYDITARKEAETALRQSEQRFRLMAETIQDVFWIATPGIGKMEYVSPAYEQVWGRTCQELYQSPQSFIDAIHPEDRERVKSEITAAREQGIPWSHEYRIIRPDGTGRWIQDRGFPVRDDQGRVILFTGVAADITEQKTLEQQFLQAQKMEAVGRLAGGVAHDFNNLLMAIMGYGELMRAKVLKDDPLYGYLENILKAGDRATALTQQLLTFSRRQIVHPQVIDLNRVVLDLEPMLRRLIGEDLDLEVVTDRRLGAVKADPGQVGQIIMNLVVNARDAMPQGGRLTLKTAAVNFTVGCHSRFGLTPPGPYVMLEVQDTGVGMDEATQAHVFEPFFTTKEPGKGTGLGLSTVYGIVRQSGGYLDLASEPGAGSTFTIYLPRLEAIVEPPKAKIPITASFRGEETILLVEDEDVLRGLLAKFLRLYGYTVLEARHGGEALLICERHQGAIHVMVTDVVMPQMSGRELADRLTPLRPEMKILYMSGYTEDALVQHGVTDLSVAFLQKPFRPIELARRVHAILHPPVSQ